MSANSAPHLPPTKIQTPNQPLSYNHIINTPIIILYTAFKQTTMGDIAANHEEEHIFRSKHSSVPVPENLTLPEFVLEGAENYADTLALVDADEAAGKCYTYGEVVRDTRRFAWALRSLGLRKGHVVMVALPNLAVYPVVALGIMASGGVFSGVNPLSTAAEIGKQVENSEAKIIVADAFTYEKTKELNIPIILIGEEHQLPGTINWSDLLQAADRAGPTTAVPVDQTLQQSDVCALPYSSGTTGSSKGVMLTHRNLIANLCSSLFSVPPEMVGQMRTLGLMPFFHIYGITGICCAALRNRGRVVVLRRFELRSFIGAMIEHEVTFAPLVPPIMLAMVKSPVVDEFDLGRLKLQSVLTAAAPLAAELRSAFEEKFPGVEIQEAYGLTEHSCITLTHADPRTGQINAKKNSVGFILPNIEIKFVDPESGQSLALNMPGELCVRSQCVMQGYYKNKEETERAVDEGGWLHTGDIGYIDDDGDIFIVDRIKELIKYKGFQVAPAELEALLLAHPSVNDAAVFALPDEEAGEIPAACVVKKAGAEESEEDMMRYVASNVASYKKVRLLKFINSIPKSASGKIMRRVLKDIYTHVERP